MRLEIVTTKNKVKVLLNGHLLRAYPRFSLSGIVRFETGQREAKTLIRALRRAEKLGGLK